MHFREATIDDIPHMQIVRNAVTENTLSDPSLISNDDYVPFITSNGKGWVCVINNHIVGFAIVDLSANNIWALFVDPAFEQQGIGQQLHNAMLDWYFAQTTTTVWLGTAFDTRAEKFYRRAGWTAVGIHGADEIKFEMTYDYWTTRHQR